MKSKFLRNTLAAVFSGVFAAGASAATFNFVQSSGFDTTSLTSTDNVGADDSIRWFDFTVANGQFPVVGNASPAGTFDTVAWGLPSVNNGGAVGFDPFLINGGSNADYSGLRVIGFSGQLSTGNMWGSFGNWVSISRTYHRNQTISASAFTLTSGSIVSNFLLVEPNLTDPHGIPFAFLETMNTAPGGIADNCVNGAPQGTVCDDLFMFPQVGLAPLKFKYLHTEYEIEFAIADFVNASSDFPGCDGGPLCTVWTAEEQLSSLDVKARIREIPEPSTIALLGAALLGLGLRRRKV